MKDCAKFVEMLLHAGTNAHILHLKTKSYAQHKALGEFYESIIELTDDFAEAYQGVYGLITEYPGEYKPPNDDPIMELRNLGARVKTLRKSLPQDTELQNLIDEIAGEIDQTLYKLRFLK